MSRKLQRLLPLSKEKEAKGGCGLVWQKRASAKFSEILNG
jgi:hypothetical protein